jgi:hypothetical protein
MNKKMGLIMTGVIVLLLIITGIVVYKTVFSGSPPPPTTQDLTPTELPAADAAIQVYLTKSTAAADTVVISAKGLTNMSTIAYELTYESNGLIKGVNSGSKPADVSGKDSFERDIYLGTCSRNVCKPDTGVSKVTLSLVFTNAEGKQSQFSKDYTL